MSKNLTVGAEMLCFLDLRARTWQSFPITVCICRCVASVKPMQQNFRWSIVKSRTYSFGDFVTCAQKPGAITLQYIYVLKWSTRRANTGLSSWLHSHINVLDIYFTWRVWLGIVDDFVCMYAGTFLWLAASAPLRFSLLRFSRETLDCYLEDFNSFHLSGLRSLCCSCTHVFCAFLTKVSGFRLTNINCHRRRIHIKSGTHRLTPECSWSLKWVYLIL